MRKFLTSLLCLQLCTQFAFAKHDHHSSSSTSSSSSSNSGHHQKADYIIVGLGTAGAVCARYLSDPVKGKYNNSVLVFEAGQNRSDDPLIYTPVGLEGPTQINELIASSKYSLSKQCPDDNPFSGFGGSELYSSGRMWFGSSGHNFLFAVRGTSDRWDELAQAVGNPEWSYNNLIPAMKFLETYTGVSTQPALRGTNGPLFLTQDSPVLTPAVPFASFISTATGAPLVPDYNVPDGNTAVAIGQRYVTPDFQKRSYAFNFLPPSILNSDGTAADGRKLQVVSGATVHRVIFDGKKAIGIEYFKDNDDKPYTAYAKKKVILCAGCPLSAAILQHSGIGPRDVLEQPKVNVPVLIDNPLVGTGLKTHYGVVYAMTQPENPNNALPFEVPMFVDGRNAFPPAGTGDGVRRFWGAAAPQLGILPLSLLYVSTFDPFGPGIAGFLWMTRPQSSGTAYLVDSSPFTMPDIRFKLYTDGDLTKPDSDINASVAMFKIAKQIADEAGCTMIYPPAWHYASDELLALDSFALLEFSILTVTNHYTGTCQMGTDISNSVISSKDLHVHGVKNLMVADSSIYPFPETGNTSFQCYLAGLKAAKILGAKVP